MQSAGAGPQSAAQLIRQLSAACHFQCYGHQTECAGVAAASSVAIGSNVLDQLYCIDFIVTFFCWYNNNTDDWNFSALWYSRTDKLQWIFEHPPEEHLLNSECCCCFSPEQGQFNVVRSSCQIWPVLVPVLKCCFYLLLFGLQVFNWRVVDCDLATGLCTLLSKAEVFKILWKVIDNTWQNYDKILVGHRKMSCSIFVTSFTRCDICMLFEPCNFLPFHLWFLLNVFRL